ncbi:hypothetical protein L6164_000911 [Bauhinia variegata]|uniref:Uncharacterized protein n=1 Tax=Bauhinia variegata TaxID=167791 RepID=A0ACB9QE35_BAUVA|nr:hypothetical protein L6164_000911 [Bauhinia variegata]
MASAKSHKILSASYQKINLAPDEETSALSELLIDISSENGDQVDSSKDASAPDGITASGMQNFKRHRELDEGINNMDLYEFGLWGEKCCIYEVPQGLRKEENLLAYTPQYVSIGPIHHKRKDNLKTMEKLKMTYRESFETRLPEGKDSIEKYRCSLEQHEQKIRLCYSKKFDDHILEHNDIEGKNQFLDIIMLDAIFIMELFIIRVIEPKQESHLPLPKPWMLSGLRKDLQLLENQLPIFVLVKLYDDFVPISLKEKCQCHCFYQLAFKYFFNPGDQFIIPSYYKESKHFTDMLRYRKLPTAYKNLTYQQEECFHKLKTAIKLDAAGITIERQQPKQKIEFKKGKFLLSMIPWMKCFKARFIIPPLNVDDTTELLYRNIIALEQCLYPDKPYISSYIAILDRLIDSEEDTHFLMNKGIINHTMGSNKEVADLFNNLLKDVDFDYEFFGHELNEIHEHCINPWNNAMATLKSVYFCSVWRGSLTVVGIVVFLLSIFNSAYTFLKNINF